jgi:hypothetical protein
MKLRKNKEKGLKLAKNKTIKYARTKLEKTPNLRDL